MSLHPDRNYFKEFKGDCTTFVETGTFKGDGMNAARDAGFLTIHSIDIIQHEQLHKYNGVGIWKRYIDDSPVVLQWLLPTIKEPYMIWLDAHSQMTEDEPDNYPLFRELDVIAQVQHRPKVILIDDFLYMTHPWVTGWVPNSIIHRLRDLGYKMQYLPNPVKNNILYAHY